MAEIGDIQGFEKTYRDQLDKLDAADIDDRDREQIRSLVRRRNVEGNPEIHEHRPLDRRRHARDDAR